MFHLHIIKVKFESQGHRLVFTGVQQLLRWWTWL